VRRVTRGGLKLLLFPSLEEAGLVCALSTRPLDVGAPDGMNRLVVAAGLDPARAARMLQVHHAGILRVDAPGSGTPPQTDGLVTDVAGLALCARAADCSLVVVADPRHRALGAAHAGWKGSARGVVVNLVRALREAFGSRPSDLLAAVGPTIGVDHYPVGPEVASAFLKRRGWVKEYVQHRSGRLHFDLAGVNRRFLIETGIPPEQIEMSGLDTYADRELLHSFRRDSTRAGRHGLVAAWPPTRRSKPG